MLMCELRPFICDASSRRVTRRVDQNRWERQTGGHKDGRGFESSLVCRNWSMSSLIHSLSRQTDRQR